jgi:hypothetical protein
MTSASKAKGDRAEREAAALAAALTGYPVRRRLGAGRADDTGDLDGIPDHVVQVADWKDALRAVWEKPLGAEAQRGNAAAGYAATFVWLPRRGFRVVLTPEQWAAYVQATATP